MVFLYYFGVCCQVKAKGAQEVFLLYVYRLYPKNKNFLLPNVQRTRAMTIFIEPAEEEQMYK